MKQLESAPTANPATVSCDVTLSYPLHAKVGSAAARQVAIHVKSHPSWPLIGRERGLECVT